MVVPSRGRPSLLWFKSLESGTSDYLKIAYITIWGAPQRGQDGCPQAGELVGSRMDPGGPTYVGPILGTAVSPMV